MVVWSEGLTEKQKKKYRKKFLKAVKDGLFIKWLLGGEKSDE